VDKRQAAISGPGAIRAPATATDIYRMSLRDKLVDLAWQRWVLKERAAAGAKPKPQSKTG
jgi:hypothetical protein